MSLDRIREFLTQLPSHSLVHGGSHAGKLYQNYPWPPLDVLPAHRNDTQARLDWLLGKLGDVRGCSVLDYGCGNGALAIGLAGHGAAVDGLSIEPIEVQIANLAVDLLYEYWETETEKHWTGFRVAPLTCEFFTREYLPHPSTRVDYCLFLSTWKWVVRNEGLDTANTLLQHLSIICHNLIFESGLTGGGMDLGLPFTKADITDILRKHTSCEPELLGIEPREDGTEREVWRCRRSA